MEEAEESQIGSGSDLIIPDLPIELWGIIFKNVSQNEVLNLRLVCKKWKTEIDDYYPAWAIDIDDKSPFLQHILRLRIKECKIISLLKPSPLGPNFQNMIFKHPELIKDVTIMEDFDKYFDLISPGNLHILLKTCSKSLEDLILSLTETLLTSTYYQEQQLPHSNDLSIGYHFENLKNLSIVIQKDKPDRLDTTLKILQENMFYQLISRSRMPKLKSLSVKQNVELSKMSFARLSHAVLSFLAKHGNILEHLIYNNYFFSDGEADSGDVSDQQAAQFEDIDLNLLRQANCLETLCLSLNAERVPYLKNAWKLLLEHQTKLKGLVANNLPITSTSFRTLLYSNFETITSVEIDCFAVIDRVVVDGVVKRIFNMSAFENCRNLKRLILSNDNTTVHPGVAHPNAWEFPELCNLSGLPGQLKLIELTEYMIRSDDVLEFFRNHSTLLSSFTCRRCVDMGDGPDYGITGSIMEEVINGENALKYVCIDIFNSRNPVEFHKLKAIFQTVGIEEFGNPYFPVVLIRETVPGVWETEDQDIIMRGPSPPIPDVGHNEIPVLDLP